MREADRAQAIQIGALFVFAFLIIGISVAQLFVVPDQNGQVEFNHNREVQDQMIDLRKDLLRTVATGQSRASTVTLGTTYPSRGVLLNPGPPGGTLRTEPLGSYHVDNALATDGEAADYWRGTNRSFVTKRIVYQPGYNYYTNAPRTVFESTVLYNRYPTRNVTVEGETIVSGRTINLVLINGSLSASSTGSTTVEPTAIGGEARTVQVEAESGSEPIVLTVPTRLSEEAWRSLLSSELETGSEDPDRYIESLDCSNAATDSDPSAPCRNLKLTFETNTEYNLVLGEAGVGSRINRSHADPRYVVTTAGDGATVPEGSSRQLTVEVRDRFDNPVSGATVRFETRNPRAGHLRNDTTRPAYGNGSITATTGVDGRATITYDAPLNVDRRIQPTVVATALQAPTPASRRPDQAEFDIAVQDDDEDVSDDDWTRPLLTAVEPDPNSGSDDAEFVELYVPDGVDGTYVLRAERADGTGTVERTLDLSTVSGTVYVTKDRGAFTSTYGSASGTVLTFSGTLPDDTGLVQVERDGDGYLVDQVAYGDGGATTTDGWAVTDGADGTALSEDQLVGRLREDSAYVDTNASADWAATAESGYFGGGGGPGGGTGGPPPSPPGRNPALAPPRMAPG